MTPNKKQLEAFRDRGASIVVAPVGGVFDQDLISDTLSCYLEEVWGAVKEHVRMRKVDIEEDDEWTFLDLLENKGVQGFLLGAVSRNGCAFVFTGDICEDDYDQLLGKLP